MSQNNKDYAPVVVFAFNRLETLKNTICSLAVNPEAKESDLIVFVDGPRESIENEKSAVKEVQLYARAIEGFKSLNYHFSDVNKGLGPNIIQGISKVINQYGSAIVIEDDLVVNPSFLGYMNQALLRYQKEERVFSICGYTNKVKPPKEYSADCYFCTRSSSWGWATWSDRWNSIDWDLESWEEVKKHHRAFNRWGGSDCWHMLNDWHKGKNKSWAIRFCFAQFLQNKISLFPIKSLVVNDGFDGNGTNCKKWSRFKCELDKTAKKEYIWPSTLQINENLYKQALRYHSIPLRIWSKIMYLIHQ